MPRPSPIFRHALKFLGYAVFWTLVGLAFAGQFYLSSNLLGRSITWREAITNSLGDWYVWALLSVPIARFARRFPPEAGTAWRTAGIHLGAAIGFSFAWIGLYSAFEQAGFEIVAAPGEEGGVSNH